MCVVVPCVRKPISDCCCSPLSFSFAAAPALTSPDLQQLPRTLQLSPTQPTTHLSREASAHSVSQVRATDRPSPEVSCHCRSSFQRSPGQRCLPNESMRKPSRGERGRASSERVARCVSDEVHSAVRTAPALACAWPSVPSVLLSLPLLVCSPLSPFPQLLRTFFPHLRTLIQRLISLACSSASRHVSRRGQPTRDSQPRRGQPRRCKHTRFVGG